MPHNGSQLLSTDPIVLSRYSGHVTVEDVQQGSGELAEHLKHVHGKLYVVVDLLDVDSSFADVIRIITDQSQGREGTTTDPRIGAIALVGTHSMAKLFSQAMQKRHQDVHIPMYTKMDDALAAVKMLIEYDVSKRAS